VNLDSSSSPSIPVTPTESAHVPGQVESNFHPASRSEDPHRASRNVFRGLLSVCIAAIGAFGLLVLEGPRGLLPLALAFGVLLVLWSLERLGVFRQPNGAFCAFGVVAIFAVLAGFSDFAYQRYSGDLKSLAGKVPDSARTLPLELVPEKKPVEVEAPPKEVAPVSSGTVSQLSADPRMASIQEARRRYPDIWVPGSRQNKAFLEATEQLKRSGPELLKEPDWVLRLAESLAREEGWDSDTRPAATPEPSGASVPLESSAGSSSESRPAVPQKDGVPQ
jgi:hypothetical protein